MRLTPTQPSAPRENAGCTAAPSFAVGTGHRPRASQTYIDVGVVIHSFTDEECMPFLCGEADPEYTMLPRFFFGRPYTAMHYVRAWQLCSIEHGVLAQHVIIRVSDARAQQPTHDYGTGSQFVQRSTGLKCSPCPVTGASHGRGAVARSPDPTRRGIGPWPIRRRG